jgi:hypothetical protein
VFDDPQPSFLKQILGLSAVSCQMVGKTEDGMMELSIEFIERWSWLPIYIQHH